MELIKEFEPTEVQSSVTLANRLNQLVRAVNSVLADPEEAKRGLELIARRDRELLRLDQQTRSPEQKPFSGLRSVSRQELNRVALRYDVLDPEKYGDPEEIITLISLKVDKDRKAGDQRKVEDDKEKDQIDNSIKVEPKEPHGKHKKGKKAEEPVRDIEPEKNLVNDLDIFATEVTNEGGETP